MTIGQRISNRRQELGMTQEELAFKMGYKTRNAIYQYEKAENMKLSLIEKFAEALNCSTSYLMGWDEEQSAEDKLKEAYIRNNEKELLYSYFSQLSPEKQDSLINLIKAMI